MAEGGVNRERQEEEIKWERFPKSTQAAFRGVLADPTLSIYEEEVDSPEDYTNRMRVAIGSVSESGDFPTLSNRQIANSCIELAESAEGRGDERLAEEYYFLADIARAMIRPNKK